MNALDPFVVTTKEKLRFEQQFNALGPVSGIVTGAQAKGFLLKSGLSPLVLGQIWALADTDADGKMDLIEFSIACKLISLKLRNQEVPKMLPPTLLASLKHVGTPIRTPTGSMSPTEGYKQFITQPIQQPVPMQMPVASVPAPALITAQQQYQQPQILQGQPMMQPQTQMMNQAQPIMIPQNSQPIGIQAIPHHQIPPEMMAQQQMMMSQQPMMVHSQQIVGPPQIIPMTSAVPMIPTGTVMPSQPPMMTSNIPNASMQVVPPSKPSLINQLSSGSLLDSLVQVQPAVPPTSLPAAPTPTPPQSGHASRSMSFSEKAPSVPESPSSEWAIPQSSKLKYTQLFNTTDKTRSGFLTGTQARGILLQTKVPQQTLAQIWAMSDRDSDGRLGCEEFVLALYLCEMYATGKPIPAELPLDLIPPSFRKVVSRHGSVVNSRHGSVSSQGAATTQGDVDALAGMHAQNSFEDKRKENYDKGQAELERRRKALADMQKKEQEERERKERDEADKRERARLEVEAKKQQEIEREAQRQKEIELEREEQRKRELEKKEQARKELEKQRQQEWEAQKLQEMEQERQREQDRLLKLKGQNQTLTIELESLSTKVKDLSQKICDTRVAVTNVKTVIDGMRTTRDTCVSEQTQFKAKIKEQNAKLVQLSQEKARMDAKSKINPTAAAAADDQAMFTNKQIIIKQLRDKVENIKSEIEVKSTDVVTHQENKNEARNELSELISNCEQLYNDYDIVRIQVLELKNNRKNDSYTTSSAWPTESKSAWAAEEPKAPEPVVDEPTPTGYLKYRAIYEFAARNNDEITFQPGDIVMVPFEQNGEAGWLAGQINGHTGWFPETYVEKVDDGELESAVSPEVQPKLEEIREEPVAEPAYATDAYNGDVGEKYIACFPYQSAEAGDLIFEAGEEVLVVKKEGDWWTGVIGNRTGIFPANYVQPPDNNSVTNGTTTTISNDFNSMNINGTAPDQISNVMSAEEARNQADADSEVSQINTQNVSIDAGMQEFRGMTASASLRAKKGEVATVIAPYEATSSEQLSLQKGQLVMIRKKTDSGWWEGELQTKGRRRQVGWFPATYVKVLAGGRMSGRNTPLSSSKINLHETIIDKVQAMYPYKALNDDELSFEPDDIISVLSRDEPDWWRGELNGITGLFPSNYVRTFVSSGKK